MNIAVLFKDREILYHLSDSSSINKINQNKSQNRKAFVKYLILCFCKLFKLRLIEELIFELCELNYSIDYYEEIYFNF